MEQNGAKSTKVRKERAQLSCAFCRHRKLKCDRNQPCENCVKRNQNCHYATPVANRIGKHQEPTSSTIQNRIQHLEGLVLSLMNHDKDGSIIDSDQSPSATSGDGSSGRDGRRSSSSRSSQDPEAALKSFGMMNVDDSTRKYVGNEHWAAILHDIEEVKSHLDTSAPTEEELLGMNPLAPGPDLLLGFAPLINRAELLSTLPPRATADSLISAFMNSSDPFICMYHLPTFKAEYERGWKDQYAAPLQWVSMVYSMLCLSTFWQTRATDQSKEVVDDLRATSDFYRRQAVKCLIASGYTVPTRYTVEAVLIYLGTEYLRSHEIEVSLWVIFGMAVRLAMSMGYHRDASHFSNISVFEGEMRRRVWASIAQLDILTSVQVGLPRMVRDSTADARIAGNYVDEDLNEDMQLLPPSRPHAEYTKMSYQIVKSRLTKALGLICDEIDRTQNGSYEEVLRLDGILLEAHGSMPEVLRMKPMTQALGDKPSTIMRRINLELVFLKSRCILHRKYLTAARTNSQYAFSREAGVSAATEILRHQISLDAEIQVGGRLSSDKWLISALVANDFTLAAMIICLDLDYRTSGPSIIDSDEDDEELYQLLEQSSVIWRKWSRQYISTAKARMAAHALSIMLEKVRKMKVSHNGMPQEQSNGDSESPYEQYVYAGLDQPKVAFEPMPVPDLTDAFQPMPPSDDQLKNADLSAIENWIDAPQDIQWTQWDELFMPPTSTQDVAKELWPLEDDLFHGDISNNSPENIANAPY